MRRCCPRCFLMMLINVVHISRKSSVSFAVNGEQPNAYRVLHCERKSRHRTSHRALGCCKTHFDIFHPLMFYHAPTVFFSLLDFLFPFGFLSSLCSFHPLVFFYPKHIHHSLLFSPLGLCSCLALTLHPLSFLISFLYALVFGSPCW